MAEGAGAWLTLRGEVLGETIDVLRARGREAMNALSDWEVEVLAADGPLDTADLLGTAVTLVLEDAQDEAARAIALVVTDAIFTAEATDGLVYTIRLAPPEWLLTLRSGYRIFRDKTGPDLVRQLLRDAGTSEDCMAFRLAGSYGLRLHTAQYDELDWAFLERICAEEGISYWFDTGDSGPVIVFGDAPGSHDGVETGRPIPFEDPSNRVRPRALFELEVTEELTEDAVYLRDYDVRHPDVLIEGAAGAGAREMYEYPARVLDAAQARERARVRLEQLQRFRVRAIGRSDSTRLQPGRVVKLVGTADGELDADYLVVSVEHRWSRPTPGVVEESGYQNEVVLVPKDGPGHRPAAPTERPAVPPNPWRRPPPAEPLPAGRVAQEPHARSALRPRASGVETAIVAGPAGEEIHVNDLAELKIRFPWDRSGITDDSASTWVRTLQMGLGGALLIPRVGWEVPVTYYDGDPDRPLVLGRLYNAQGVVPYGLPGAKATTALQSATSPGGGSTNELRMGDAGGRMEMFLHASRDQSVFVGGSATSKVSVDASHDVGQSLAVSITADQTLTVGTDQTVNVVTDDSLGVKGARTETVGGVETNKVTGNRVVAAKGAYDELVGALYGLQANQVNSQVTGFFSQMIGATMAHASGLGTSESVGGLRAETVGGVRSITAAKAYGESVYGTKTVTAGACRAKAGTIVATTTKGAQSTQVGGSVDIKAGGPAVFAANQIEIQAASLDAGALKLAGGSFKVTKGAAKLDGKVKRRGGSKIG
ncbi:type VI secretion system Vgr family protein [Sorangium sp. So ce1153]|uniref:type VI secretion system Vgr family protein n=1 Tax=Sorangium sp. So ce1153 TaxID=3133333 RepID=UPI003F63C036